MRRRRQPHVRRRWQPDGCRRGEPHVGGRREIGVQRGREADVAGGRDGKVRIDRRRKVELAETRRRTERHRLLVHRADARLRGGREITRGGREIGEIGERIGTAETQGEIEIDGRVRRDGRSLHDARRGGRGGGTGDAHHRPLLDHRRRDGLRRDRRRGRGGGGEFEVRRVGGRWNARLPHHRRRPRHHGGGACDDARGSGCRSGRCRRLRDLRGHARVLHDERVPTLGASHLEPRRGDTPLVDLVRRLAGLALDLQHPRLFTSRPCRLQASRASQRGYHTRAAWIPSACAV